MRRELWRSATKTVGGQTKNCKGDIRQGTGSKF